MKLSHVARSALIVAVFFGLEKALGFVRQVAIARTFGLSPELDAFNAANNLPDLLFALISGGALGIAFIPVLSEYLQTRGRPAAWDLFSRIANLFFLTTAVLSIIVAIFADQLVQWRLGIAPGFTPEQQSLVAELMRINLIATLLFALGGLVIAGLQANQHFLLPAMAPSMYDIGTLIGIFILVPEKGITIGPLTLPAFGMGIYGLAYGVILGAVLFLLVQIPGLIRFQFRWTPAINLHHPGVKQVLGLLGPRILTVLCIQINYIAQDNIASRLVTGSVTALVYGWLFMQVPETIIGTALGTALLPTLSEQIVRREQSAFQQVLNRALRLILALTIPIAVLISVTIQPVVGILGFDPSGTSLVTWSARAYLLGLMGHSLLEVSVRAFYAQQNARTPLLAAGLTTAAFIFLAILLAPRLGAPGIALANAIAFTGEAFFLWFLLNRRFPGILKAGNTLARVIPAAFLGGVIAYAITGFSLPALPQALFALTAGGLIVLPFIRPELRVLIKL